MKNQISAKQLTYASGLFIIASNLLTKSLYIYTKNDTWISVVVATVAGILIVSIYGKLVQNHPGRNLFDIFEDVFGVAGGKSISALYVFFFLTLTVFNTQDLGSFVSGYVLPTTHLNIIYVAFLIICGYTVRKGAEKMTMYGAFILFVYLALLLFISGLLIPKMHPENIKPVFTEPPKDIILSANMVTMLPYTEIFVFLMLAHHFGNPEATGKALRRGLLIGAAITFILVVRDILVLGDYTLYTSSPTFNTIRLIDVGDILTRLEIINAVLQIILLFFKVSILLYALTAGIGRLFNIGEYNIFTNILSALCVICAGFFFISSSEHQQWFRTAGVYSTLFVLILPIITLIVSELRKAAEKKTPDEPLRLD